MSASFCSTNIADILKRGRLASYLIGELVAKRIEIDLAEI